VKKTAILPRSVNPPTDGDGNSIANKILLSLSRKEYSQVLPKLEFVG
jgi:hypothetical protein